MPMKQLSGLDATFLYLEKPEMPMHVGAMTLLELPAGYQRPLCQRPSAALRRPHASRAGPAPPPVVDAPESGESGLGGCRARSQLPHRRTQAASPRQKERPRQGRAHAVRRKSFGAAPPTAGPQQAVVAHARHRGSAAQRARPQTSGCVLSAAPCGGGRAGRRGPGQRALRPHARAARASNCAPPGAAKPSRSAWSKCCVAPSPTRWARWCAWFANCPPPWALRPAPPGAHSPARTCWAKGSGNVTLAPATPMNVTVGTGRAFASASVPAERTQGIGPRARSHPQRHGAHAVFRRACAATSSNTASCRARAWWPPSRYRCARPVTSVRTTRPP